MYWTVLGFDAARINAYEATRLNSVQNFSYWQSLGASYSEYTFLPIFMIRVTLTVTAFVMVYCKGYICEDMMTTHYYTWILVYTWSATVYITWTLVALYPTISAYNTWRKNYDYIYAVYDPYMYDAQLAANGSKPTHTYRYKDDGTA